MGFLEEVAELCPTKGPACAVGVVLASDDAELVSALGVVLANPAEYPAPAVATALKARGHKVSHGAVQRHRRGACACGVR